MSAVAETVDDIRLATRCRRYYHSAEKRLTLQLLAVLRATGLEKAEARNALTSLDQEIRKGRGQSPLDTQNEDAPLPKGTERSGPGHDRSEVHTPGAAAPHSPRQAGDQSYGDPQRKAVPGLPPLDAPIREVLDRLAEQRIALRTWRKEWEARAEACARRLPAWSWVETMEGAGPSTLALIVGETGDFANYENPAKLWKRLGVDVWPDGRTRRKVADKKLAEEMAYNPRRRSVLWNVGANLIRAQGRYYSEVYLPRKEYEASRAGCGRGKCGDASGHCTKGHAHRKAQRYMEKRFVRDLWRAWTNLPVSPNRNLSGPAGSSQPEAA